MNVQKDKNETKPLRQHIDELLNAYTRHLKAVNRSMKTITWYADILHRFFDFLDRENPVMSIADIGREELRRYILHLQNAKRWPNRPHSGDDKGSLSPYSIQGHVRAIKAFWSWLLDEGHIDTNPLVRFPLPTVPQYVIPTLKDEQIHKLLNAIDEATPLGMKYYCALLLLLDTGARISEGVSIKLTDIDFTNGLVTVFGKGQKQRKCPFSSWIKRKLSYYIKNIRQRLCREDSPYLFPAADGDHISVNSVQQYMRRLARKAGIDTVRCSPHILRHTFATRAIANGANVAVVKEILGHASVLTTEKYTHLQAADLKAQHDRFSPVAALMGKKR